MTRADDRGPFGAATTFDAAVRLWRRHLFVLTAIGFLGLLAIGSVSAVVAAATGSPPMGMVFELLCSPYLTAILLHVAFALAADGTASVRDAVQRTNEVVVPLVVLSLVSSLLVGIGLILLIVPGVIAAALILCVQPAVIFEDVRWQALDRSTQLARPYVMPLIGVFLRTFLVIVPVILLELVAVSALAQAELLIFAMGASLFMSAILLGFSAAIVLTCYLRLRNLADGDGPRLEGVFE